MDDYEKLMMIFGSNANKTFVQRIMRPDNFPRLEHEGGYATHRMSWGQLGDKYVAYPTVLYDGKKLVDHGDKAWEQVSKTNNYITFDSADEADWFTKNYKSAWGGKRNNVP